jgi:hypothetical protein
MAKEIPSVGDLRHKSEVTDDEIEAATWHHFSGTGRHGVAPRGHDDARSADL